MEDNQKKSDEGQDLKKQNMAMMFDRMLRKDKQCSYYTPISTMAKTERSTQLFSWDSMHHFSDNFLRFLPKTIQSPPDMHRKYWPEHLECKVLSLVKDKSINEAIHQKSYDNLLHILKGNTTFDASQTLQLTMNKEKSILTETPDLTDHKINYDKILTQVECAEELAEPTTESDYLIARLLETERKYIEDMEIMVTNYVELVETAPIWMPSNLIGHKIRLFGNIEEILKFHKMVFYPELLKNFKNALEITKIIIKHIKMDSFEPYITFGILDKQTKCWRQYFLRFLNKVQKTCGKKFKLEPTEHLAKYQKFLQLIQKEVDQQSSAKVFKEAENKIHLLLVKISNAFGIYDEFQANCYKLPVHLQIEVMNMMNSEFNFDLNKPLLFIVPHYDKSLGYQAPFDIFQLGKLVECPIEQVRVIKTNYLVKYFVFKQCLIYTKYCKDKLLFGKCYNIRDLKIIEAQDAPLDMRIKCRQSPRFVFLDGMAVYSIVLVDIIEKLQKNNANAGQLQIPLNHPAVQQMLDKIHHFIYFKYSNCPKQILAFGSSFNYGKCLINKTFF